MNVKTAEKAGPIKLGMVLALPELPEKHKRPKVPKTARLKIINGRGYFYSLEYIYDKATKECKQKQKYLGKTLPLGYRLVK